MLVLNGPNLDRLGTRQPEIYGLTTLAELEEGLRRHGAELGLEVECMQSADAGALARAIAERRPDAVIVNPASLTHYSYELRDALAACGMPVYEVHISNIYAREPYRRHSVVSPVARGVVMGLGVRGYLFALQSAAEALRGTLPRRDAPGPHGGAREGSR